VYPQTSIERLGSVIALVASCAASPPVAATAPLPTPLGEVFPIHGIDTAPIVTVEVGGLPLELLLDTGANAHVLLSPAVQLVGGTPGQALSGHDAGGRVTANQLDDVEAAIGRTVLRPLMQVYSSPVLLQRHLAGVLSPLVLAPSLRIDLIGGRLTIGARSPIARPISFRGSLERCPDPRNRPQAMVDVEVGGERARLELDTGTSVTTFDRNSPVGRRLAASTGKPIQVGALTQKVTADAFDAVDVHAGLHHRTITARIADMREECTGSQGVLGMDMLSGCMLDVDGDRFSAYCQAEPVALPPLAPGRIRVGRVELAPACDVDVEQMARATTPATPWVFDSWANLILELSREPDQIEPRDIGYAARLVGLACYTKSETNPRYRLTWHRGEAGLVLHYERIN